MDTIVEFQTRDTKTSVFKQMCQSTLHIHTLYRGLVSRVLFPLSFANQCSDRENQLPSVSQVIHLFLKETICSFLLPTVSHFFLFFKGSVFNFQFVQQNSLLYVKRPLNRAHTFLKRLYYSWNHSILIISFYQMFWEEFFLLIAMGNSSKENLY